MLRCILVAVLFLSSSTEYPIPPQSHIRSTTSSTAQCLSQEIVNKIEDFLEETSGNIPRLKKIKNKPLLYSSGSVKARYSWTKPGNELPLIKQYHLEKDDFLTSWGIISFLCSARKVTRSCWISSISHNSDCKIAAEFIGIYEGIRGDLGGKTLYI